MTRPLDPVVPEALRAALERDESLTEGFTMLALTESGGWPHLAMLSVGEVVALGETRLALALWPSSRTAAALSPAGRATLAAVVDRVSYLVRIQARRGPDVETPLAGRRARFDAEVVGADADEAPYAVLESGVRFRLKDRDATLARWREVRAALYSAGGGR